MMWKRRFSSRRRMTREDKAREEMAWRKINEDIELEREGVEPLLDSYFVYSTEVRYIRAPWSSTCLETYLAYVCR